jgi:hypothetical protein
LRDDTALSRKAEKHYDWTHGLAEGPPSLSWLAFTAFVKSSRFYSGLPTSCLPCLSHNRSVRRSQPLRPWQGIGELGPKPRRAS